VPARPPGKAAQTRKAKNQLESQALAAEARAERRIPDVVNAVYGLTPEDVARLWRTAPPRMPAPPPAG
jgi:hypothetical protein